MTTISARQPRQRVKDTNTFVAHFVVAFFALIMMFPFAWQIVMSLSTNTQVTGVPPTLWPGVLQWRNFVDALTAIPFGQQMWVTLQVTIIVNLAHIVLCTTAGYAFARMDFPAKRTLFAIVLAMLMVPSEVSILPVYQIIQGLDLLNTVTGIVLPGLVSVFGIFLMRQFFISLPHELEEAARIDGASSFQIFWRIMLPLSVPGIGVLVILGILDSWNDLLWPLIVATGDRNMPISVGLATLQGDVSTDYVTMMAASLMAMAPILILFIVMQRRVLEGISFISK